MHFRSVSFFLSVCAGVRCGSLAFGCEGGAPAILGGNIKTPVKKSRVARRCFRSRSLPSRCFSPRARVLVLVPVNRR